MEIEVVTNAVQTLGRNHITFNEDASELIKQDLTSVKPALLYADTVLLRSYLVDIAQMGDDHVVASAMPLPGRYQVVRLSIDMADEVMEAYGLDPGRRPSREAALTAWTAASKSPRTHEGLVEVFKHLDSFISQHREFLSDLARAYASAASSFAGQVDSGYSDLDRAVAAGIMRVTGWTDGGPELGESEQDYVDRASDSVFGEQGAAVPMLDAGAESTWLSYGGDDATHTDARGDVANRLLSRLPAFERATIDELLDLRTELAGPVTRFRAFADELASSAPEDETERAGFVDEQWRKSVAPALADLEDQVRENHYLRQLVGAAVRKDTFLPSVATVAVGFGALQGLSSLLVAAAGLSVVPIGALLDAARGRQEVERSRLYLLHRLGRSQ
jgi:hypothetical protein